MAEISFNIAELFEASFGYKTSAFYPDMQLIKGNGGKSSPGRKAAGANGSPYYANGLLGREYFMPVTLSYIDKNPEDLDTTVSADINSSKGKIKEWNLPYPVISVSSKKTIIETPLTERRGTVKELINIQDYEIIIKGFIVSASNEFPEREVTMLRNVYEQNMPISIQCPLTDIFLLRPDRGGSDQVVVSELKFPVITGVKHVCPYELHMLSDEAFNLISITDH
jgi:hypothetical protein